MRRPLSFSARRRLSGLGAAIALSAAAPAAAQTPEPAAANWPMHGRTTTEQRISLLKQIKNK